MWEGKHANGIHPKVTASEIARLVATEYGFSAPGRCHLLHSGVNDTYTVDIEDCRYALRLHGYDKWWISGESDLRFDRSLTLADQTWPQYHMR